MTWLITIRVEGKEWNTICNVPRRNFDLVSIIHTKITLKIFNFN